MPIEITLIYLSWIKKNIDSPCEANITLNRLLNRFLLDFRSATLDTITVNSLTVLDTLVSISVYKVHQVHCSIQEIDGSSTTLYR